MHIFFSFAVVLEPCHVHTSCDTCARSITGGGGPGGSECLRLLCGMLDMTLSSSRPGD